VGTLSFYQREEVKDVLAYLSWLANHRDEVAFRRIANKPARGLGKTGLNRLMDAALTDYSGDILEACRNYTAKGRAARALTFLSELSERYEASEDFEHLGFLIQDLADASGLLEHYREVDRIENSQRSRNLEELVTAAADYPSTPEGLTAFLELVELDQALLEEEEEDDNRVTLITMHNTKGLEFDRVIITGMEEGLFPRGDEGFDDDELEEERRLFYVAITRARRELAFTTCRRRMLWGRYRDTLPSRFLDEIPDDMIRVEGDGDSRESSFDPWRPGVKLYHDEYGVGVVQKRMANGGHTVIHVLFESGRSATLLPEFSSHQMELLGMAGDDW
jgi:DNA helicase-2/ATP-dependent DNA helicase PcrA